LGKTLQPELQQEGGQVADAAALEIGALQQLFIERVGDRDADATRGALNHLKTGSGRNA
jgi:hypothetical protein